MSKLFKDFLSEASSTKKFDDELKILKLNLKYEYLKRILDLVEKMKNVTKIEIDYDSESNVDDFEDLKIKFVWKENYQFIGKVTFDGKEIGGILKNIGIEKIFTVFNSSSCLELEEELQKVSIVADKFKGNK